MWLLHVVAVPGNAGWQQGLALWLTAVSIGWSIALLTGEAARPDALLADLTLAAAGGLLLNLAAARLGQDPLALVFGVRLFWTALGATLLLLLAHDAVHLICRKGSPEGGRRYVISNRGGFILLFGWLSGWPSEPALIDATYDHGLGIKLMPESLHYQVRFGPLLGARAIPLLRGLSATGREGVLLVEALPGSPASATLRSAVTFNCIVPASAAPKLATSIARQVADR